MRETGGRDAFFASIVHDEYETVAEKLKAVPNINKCDDAGVTYLLAATINDRWRVVKLLLEQGVDPNCADARGRTPLVMALGTNRPNAEKIAAELLRYGADPDLKTGNRKTAREIMEMLGKTIFNVTATRGTLLERALPRGTLD